MTKGVREKSVRRVSAQSWKKRFRQSKKWREFRQRMRERDVKDYVTGSKLTKMFNLHHLLITSDEAEYTDLTDENKFICLNNKTHDCLHFLWGKDWRERYRKMGELLELMDKINSEKH